MPEYTASVQEFARVNWLFLIPLLPALGAFINLIFGSTLQRKFGKAAVHTVAIGVMVLAWIVAVTHFFFMLLPLPAEQRFLLNEVCVETGTALVSGAAIKLEGQVTVFKNNGSGPCYHCLYKDEGELDQTCSGNGVLAPLVGIIGSIQALEAIKLLSGFGEDLDGRLLVLDANYMEWRSIKLNKDPGCPVCSK